MSTLKNKKRRASQTDFSVTSAECDPIINVNYRKLNCQLVNSLPLELSNSTLYMALKHVIWYTNSLFSIKSQLDLQQCQKSADVAQRYINAAIASISPYESLDSYKLKRPLISNLNSQDHKPFASDDNCCVSEVSTLDCTNDDLFKVNEAASIDRASSIAPLLNVNAYKSQSQQEQFTELEATNMKPASQFPSSSLQTQQLENRVSINSIDSLEDTDDPIGNAVNAFEKHINSQSYLSQECTSSEWSRTNFSFSPLVESIRRDFFKYPSFKSIQLQAINAILSGKDVFVTMATGGGKSLCYQLPPLVFGCVTVVFSPLLSLIKDQIKHMQEIGLKCVENVTTYKAFATVSADLSGPEGCLLWFMTPEKYAKSSRTMTFLQKLYDENKLKLFAVDEAHCISQWGTDFRKDYRKLGSLRAKFPNVPLIALTATSPPNVTRDILTCLKIPRAVCLSASINRRNLWLEVRSKTTSQTEEMIRLLRNSGEMSAIIYCLSTRDCERVAEKLCKNGIFAGAYHAKMDSDVRTSIQQDWMGGKINVIVATMAFGMGIDKGDVRFIFHHSPPSSLDRYYQEIGRAGRDGKFSRTILWYSPHDFDRLKSLVHGKSKFVQAIDQVAAYCYEKTQCRHEMIGAVFGARQDEHGGGVCGGGLFGCDNCARQLKLLHEDVTAEAVQIVKFVSEVMTYRNNPILTVAILTHALKGSVMKVVVKYGLDRVSGHGCLKSLGREKIFEIIRKLISLGILKESHRRSRNFGRTVVSVGNGAESLISGRIRVFIDIVERATDVAGASATDFSKGDNLIDIKAADVSNNCNLGDQRVLDDHSGVPSAIKLVKVEKSYLFEAASKNNIKRSIPEQFFERPQQE